MKPAAPCSPQAAILPSSHGDWHGRAESWQLIILTLALGSCVLGEVAKRKKQGETLGISDLNQPVLGLGLSTGNSIDLQQFCFVKQSAVTEREQGTCPGLCNRAAVSLAGLNPVWHWMISVLVG